MKDAGVQMRMLKQSRLTLPRATNMCKATEQAHIQIQSINRADIEISHPVAHGKQENTWENTPKFVQKANAQIQRRDNAEAGKNLRTNFLRQKFTSVHVHHSVSTGKHQGRNTFLSKILELSRQAEHTR